MKKEKEKEKEKSKFGVKIVAPEPQPQKKEENPSEEVKERRKRRPQLKTVKEPAELKNRDLLNAKIEQKNQQEEGQIEGKKFIRKGKRSIILIEKSKLSQKLLTAEMNIQVNQENLVIQEKGNPSKKYKPTKMLGSGSFGIVYEAENSIFQNTVAMKVINLSKFVYLISMSIIGLAKKLI